MVAKHLGLERDVTFVSTGGISPSIAALKTGSIDGVILTPEQMIKLELAGEVRKLLPVADYRPKEWGAFVIFAERDFVRSNPDVV